MANQDDQDLGFTPDAAHDDLGFIEEKPSLTHRLGQVLAGASKVLDVPRGISTGPLVGSAIEGLTGKKVYSAQDFKNAINPTNLQHFPSASEMMARVGVPEGAKLSDYAPGYSKPGSPWYLPEKGGMLDPTLRGAGGLGIDMATDPLSWLSMGAAGLAKKAASEGAARQALAEAAKESAGPVGKALDMAGAPIRGALDLATPPVERAANAVSKLPGGQTLTSVVQTPSSALKALGERFYRSGILPVEFEGAKYGKKDIADTMYHAGISNAHNLPEKAGAASDALIAARDKILTQAGEQGGVASMESAMAPVREKIASIRASGDPEANLIADAMEERVNKYLALEKPTPGQPGTPAIPEQTVLGPAGPEVVTPGRSAIPGTPAIPGKNVTPMEASGYKTSLYNAMPGTAYSEASKTSLGDQLRKLQAQGLKNETENSVANVLGNSKGADVAELNAEAGKLLGTKKGQFSASNAAERKLNNLTNINASDQFAAHLEGLPGFALNKARQAAQVLGMPAGYGLQKLAEGELTGPTLDALLRRKAINTLSQPSLLNIGDDHGQK